MSGESIVFSIVVPLLLSGFLNFFAHKPWILYFPLLGVLIGVGYVGHRAIQHYAYSQPQASLNPPAPETTPTPMKKDERPNQSISTVNQSGGQNIVAGGDVHLAPPARSLSPEGRAKLIANLKPYPGTFTRIDALFGDSEAARFGIELQKAFEEAGWDVAFAEAMWAQRPSGVIVLAPNVRVPIFAIVVRDALRDAGVIAPIEVLPELPENGVRLIIGTQPNE